MGGKKKKKKKKKREIRTYITRMDAERLVKISRDNTSAGRR